MSVLGRISLTMIHASLRVVSTWAAISGRRRLSSPPSRETEKPQFGSSPHTLLLQDHNPGLQVQNTSTGAPFASWLERSWREVAPSRQLFMVEKPKKRATSVDNLISIIRELQAQIGDLKTEIQEQKADIIGLRAEIKTLSTETATNISELKAEVTQLYTAANIGTQTNSSGSAWVNPAPWSNPATNSQEWPSLPTTRHSG
jgi:cell division protein FtsB